MTSQPRMPVAQLIDPAAGFGLDLPSHGHRDGTCDGNVDPLPPRVVPPCCGAICSPDRNRRGPTACSMVTAFVEPALYPHGVPWLRFRLVCRLRLLPALRTQAADRVPCLWCVLRTRLLFLPPLRHANASSLGRSRPCNRDSSNRSNFCPRHSPSDKGSSKLRRSLSSRS